MRNFEFIEQTTTFVADKELIAERLKETGGAARLAGEWFVQFFDKEWIGVSVTIALLLVAGWLLQSTLRKVSANGRWAWLSYVALVPQYYLHYDIAYQYAGSVSMLVMALALRGILVMKGSWKRDVVSIVVATMVYYLCGPTAMLLAVLYYILSISNARHNISSYVLPVLPAAMVMILGIVDVYSGKTYSMSQLIGPEGYYYANLMTSTRPLVPWALLIVCAIICPLLSGTKILATDKKQIRIIYTLLSAFIVVGTFIAWGMKSINNDNEFFKELSVLARRHQWDEITSKCENHNMNNTYFQNYAYMAWAEKGMLDEKAGCYPANFFYSIISPSDRKPYTLAMLSDVYYSMGHIALAQRYAFEANENYQNNSPQMLQRLVEANIIFGAYPVAEKYLDILSKTRYAEWAAEYRKLLYDDKAVENHKLLGEKRRCLFPENRFSGIKGIDDDLKQILKANPNHKITLSYLRALYKLNGQFDDLNKLDNEGI